MTFPVYMLAIRPQTKSGRSLKSIGPGCRPQMRRPQSITAAVGDPGMPRVIIGSSADTPAAWAAVSGASTPSSTSAKLFRGFREFSGNAVTHKRGGVASPGLMPIQEPMSAERTNVFHRRVRRARSPE